MLLAHAPMSAPSKQRPLKRSKQTLMPTPPTPAPSASSSSAPRPPPAAPIMEGPASFHSRHYTRAIDIHYPLMAPAPQRVMDAQDHFVYVPLDTPISDNHRKLLPKASCMKRPKPSEQEAWDSLSSRKKMDLVFDRVVEITGASPYISSLAEDEHEVMDLLCDNLDKPPFQPYPSIPSQHSASSLKAADPQLNQHSLQGRGRKRLRESDEDANIVRQRFGYHDDTEMDNHGEYEEGRRPPPSPVSFSGAQVIYGNILADSIGPILESRVSKVSFAPESQESFIWRTSRPLSGREIRRRRRELLNPWEREVKRYDIRKSWLTNRRTFKHRVIRDKFVELVIENAHTLVEIELATILLDGLHQKSQAGPVFVDAVRTEIAYVVDTLGLEERTSRDKKVEVIGYGKSFFDPERAQGEEIAQFTGGETLSTLALPQLAKGYKAVGEWASSSSNLSKGESTEMKWIDLDNSTPTFRACNGAICPARLYTTHASILGLDASGISINLNVYPEPTVPLHLVFSSNPSNNVLPPGKDMAPLGIQSSVQKSDATGVYIDLNIYPIPKVPMQLSLSHHPDTNYPVPSLAQLPASLHHRHHLSQSLTSSPSSTSAPQVGPLPSPSDLGCALQFAPHTSSTPSSPTPISTTLPLPRSSPPALQPLQTHKTTIKTKFIKSIYTSDSRTIDTASDFLNGFPQNKGAHKDLDGDDIHWEDLSDGDSCATSNTDFASCWNDLNDVDVRSGWDC